MRASWKPAKNLVNNLVAVTGFVAGALFGCTLSLHAQDNAQVYMPSQAVAEWFEKLTRPDYDSMTMGMVKSCCDSGDAYPIVILQEATIGGKEPDGIAEVTDTRARDVKKPNGETKHRPDWSGPIRFKFAGEKVTREIDGNPTSTAWVFANNYVRLTIYCVVPLPPGF